MYFMLFYVDVREYIWENTVALFLTLLLIPRPWWMNIKVNQECVAVISILV